MNQMGPRIIFVGMHNKPGKMPLCSSTKSGKLIDRIIKQLRPYECLKTNLCDVEYLPTDLIEICKLRIDWHDKNHPEDWDIIILLGAWIHRNFLSDIPRTLKIAHPASKRSHIEIDDYVSKTTANILKLLK